MKKFLFFTFFLSIVILTVSCKKSETEHIEEDEGTITHTIYEKSEVDTIVSDDGNFLFYSWTEYDDSRFGSLKYICKYRTQSGKIKTTNDIYSLLKTKKNKDDCLNINALKIVGSVVSKKGEPIYVVEFYSRVDTQYGYRLLAAFTIAGDTLQSYNAFENAPYIDYSYYGIASWYFRTEGMGWEWLDSFDRNTQSIYVPEIEEECLQDRYNIYKFNGTKFCLVGNSRFFYTSRCPWTKQEPFCFLA